MSRFILLVSELSTRQFERETTCQCAILWEGRNVVFGSISYTLFSFVIHVIINKINKQINTGRSAHNDDDNKSKRKKERKKEKKKESSLINVIYAISFN